MADSKGYLEVSQDEKPPQEKKKKTIEDFARMGKYAFLVMMFTEFILLCGAGNVFFMLFAGAAPQHVSCEGSDIVIADVCKTNLDYRQFQNCTLKMKYEFKSVNVEFGHVCKETSLVKSSISVQMIGVLVGALFTGMLSDRYGRLRVFSVSYFFTVIFGIASIFSFDLVSFTIARTLQGPFIGGIVGTYMVYMTEQVPKKHRFIVSNIIAWSPNLIIMSLLAWISHDWRSLQRNLLLCSSPAFILYWFVYKSPRWLVQHGRMQEASEIMKKIQERDGVKHGDVDEIIEAEHQAQLESEGRQKHYSLRHLFRSKKLVIYLALISLGTLVTSMTSYSLAFNLEKLSGSIFVNSLVLSVIRWSVNLFFGVVDLKLKSTGRKIVHLLGEAVMSICLGLIVLTYVLGVSGTFSLLVRICTVFAISLTGQIFITNRVVLMEIFPTVIRNQAMAVNDVFARAGVIVAPQLFYISSLPVVPYLLLAVLCTLDTIFFHAVIPETKGKPLPEGLPEKKDKVPMIEKKALVL